MKSDELINDLIYHVSDSEHGYEVMVEKDGEHFNFKTELRDGTIYLVATGND